MLWSIFDIFVSNDNATCQQDLRMVDTVNFPSYIIEHNVLRYQHLYWNLTSNPCRYKLSNTCLSIIMTDSEWKDYCKNFEHFFKITFWIYIHQRTTNERHISLLSLAMAFCAPWLSWVTFSENLKETEGEIQKMHHFLWHSSGQSLCETTPKQAHLSPTY